MDPMTIAALIQGGTALYNTFGKNNPARSAGNDLGKIQGYGREAYNPFVQQGQQANQQLNPMYNQMATNPVGQYNDILSQYQPSAGYQYKQNKLNQLAHNTAAAGGYAGTGGDVADRSELFNALMGEDMQQFLSNIFGIQNAGVQGLEGQAGRGFTAAGNLADYLGTAGSQNASANYMKRLHGNESMNSGLGTLASLIGGGNFDSLFGGGNTPSAGSTQPFINLNALSSPSSFIQQGHAPYGGGYGG